MANIKRVSIGGAAQAKQNELAQIDIERLSADLDWVALMTDVELPEDEEQEMEDSNE